MIAYPIITDFFRALVAWQNETTGLPEDQYVNNLYFRNDNVTGGTQAIADAIAATVEGFYTTPSGGGTQLTQFMSPEIGQPVLKVYDLGQAAPRFPIVEPVTIDINGTGAGQLPRETACVLSFISGNGPRRRGRIYVGPLADNALAVSGGAPRPSSGLQAAMAAGANNMLNSTENCSWATVSPTAAEGHPVTEGWIDDAWDTQRSRGASPTSRVTFDGS